MDERLATVLLEEARVSPKQLEDAQKIQARDKSSLGAALVRMGVLSEADYAKLLGQLHKTQSINLEDAEISPDVINLVPAEVASKFQVIPVSRTGRQLTLAMSNPSNVFVIDDIKFITGCEISDWSASRQNC